MAEKAVKATDETAYEIHFEIDFLPDHHLFFSAAATCYLQPGMLLAVRE